MGKVLSGYKSAVINDLTNGGSHYYMFAANPVSNPSSIPTVTTDDYSTLFFNNWQMLFGKRVNANDIAPIIKNNKWISGTVYERYDNTKELTGKNYVVVRISPSGGGEGGSYNIYRCIDNNNNSPSTIQPFSEEETKTFETIDGNTTDGYKWRYITTITDANYKAFATSTYIPATPNTTVQGLASENSGIDVVVVTNSGTRYDSYHSGKVEAYSEDHKRIQISDDARADDDFYTGNSIYLKNLNSPAQIRDIVHYYKELNGTKWVVVDKEINESLISIGTGGTTYIISPKVVFKTNAVTPPVAYTIMNTVSNNISSVKIIDPGSHITWANVSFQSNGIYGTGAAAYAIVSPPGGHGVNPAEELGLKGFCISTKFANTDGLPNNVLYNKIGLIANPYEIEPDGTKSATPLTSTVFSALTEIEPKNNQVYTVGEIVRGTTAVSVFPIVANTTGIVAATDFIKIASASSYLVENDRVYYSVATGNTKIAGLDSNTYYYIASSNSTGVTLKSAFDSPTAKNITDIRTTTPSETGHLLTKDALYSYGTVAFSNTTTLLLTGDKMIADNTYIVSADGQKTSQIALNTLGDIYTKDIRPLYVQNLSDIQRTNLQSEFYKLIIQI